MRDISNAEVQARYDAAIDSYPNKLRAVLPEVLAIPLSTNSDLPRLNEGLSGLHAPTRALFKRHGILGFSAVNAMRAIVDLPLF